jgi:hypothetical protein
MENIKDGKDVKQLSIRYYNIMNMINTVLSNEGLYFVSDIEFAFILFALFGSFDDLNENAFDNLIVHRYRTLNNDTRDFPNHDLRDFHKQQDEYEEYLKDFHASIKNMIYEHSRYNITKLKEDLNNLNFNVRMLESFQECVKPGKLPIVPSKEIEDFYAEGVRLICDTGIFIIKDDKEFWNILVDLFGFYDNEYLQMLFHRMIVERFNKLHGGNLPEGDAVLKNFFVDINVNYRRKLKLFTKSTAELRLVNYIKVRYDKYS